jgi:hypothetical protein
MLLALEWHKYILFLCNCVGCTCACKLISFWVVADSIIHSHSTVRSESRCALKATVRRFGCHYQSCRCSVLLFHCIQLLNSG